MARARTERQDHVGLANPLRQSGVDAQAHITRITAIVEAPNTPARAAFDEFTSPDRMIDVDCPGLTTPNLKQLPWTRMPRPIFPIDEDVSWPDSSTPSLPLA